jgi:hypothetical protein
MFIRGDRRFDLRLLHVKLFVHWRLYALSSCFKIRILRKRGFAGRSAWSSHTLPLCSPLAYPQDCANRPFPRSSTGTWPIVSGSSTIAKVIRRSLATGVRNFCIFARISNSWLPPTPLLSSHCYGSSVESHSTALSFVLGPISRSNRHVILQCLALVFPELVLSSDRFWSLNIRDLLEN